MQGEVYFTAHEGVYCALINLCFNHYLDTSQRIVRK
jgi:hypothetical protein